MTTFVEMESVRFDAAPGRTVLRDVSLDVAAGQTLALLGRSGSGKTTALRLVNALLMPSAGAVRVAGRETSAWNPIELRRRTGYVIQDVGLFPHLSVAENVGVVPSLEGWPASRVAARTRELLELVGLAPDDFAARRPHQLSGGQRQRVGVARALAADPPLLLLDEPFAALDPVTRRELQDEFRSLATRLGKTAIFVTHDLAEAARIADRLALLEDGRLVACGTLAEVAATDHPEVSAFLRAADAQALAPSGGAPARDVPAPPAGRKQPAARGAGARP